MSTRRRAWRRRLGTSRVAKWLSGRRIEKVFDKMRSHMLMVEETVRCLNRMIEAWAEGRAAEVDRLYDATKKAEKNADNIRRETARLLSGGGGAEALERTLLLRLMGRIDKIADWAVESARILNILREEKAPREVIEVFVDFSESLIKITERTSEMIRALSRDRLRAFAIADEVENMEENIDALYAEARKKLLKNMEGLGPAAVVLFYDALDALENSADACEDSSDILREIVVRLGA